jgi:hypothetical protein
MLHGNDKKALIRIFFNAKNQVTVIEALDVAGFAPAEIKPLFTVLNTGHHQIKYNLNPATSPNSPEVLDDLTTFLSRLRSKIEAAVLLANIVVGKVESKEYHEIYHFYRELDVAVVKFYYNKKKQITRYEAVPNRCNGLETEVLPLIKAIEL